MKRLLDNSEVDIFEVDNSVIMWASFQGFSINQESAVHVLSFINKVVRKLERVSEREGLTRLKEDSGRLLFVHGVDFNSRVMGGLSERKKIVYNLASRMVLIVEKIRSNTAQ